MVAIKTDISPEAPVAIDATAEPDWSREAKPFFAWDPGKSLLGSIRAYQRTAGRSAPHHRLASKWAVLRHRFWSVVAGAEIPLNTRIGGGLAIPHPNGIIIHSRVLIGPNCLIFHQVTLGMNREQVPQLGAQVKVAAGAKIVGGIRIGDGATIGANAVVTRDVPAGATAVGVPARILP